MSVEFSFVVCEMPLPDGKTLEDFDDPVLQGEMIAGSMATITIRADGQMLCRQINAWADEDNQDEPLNYTGSFEIWGLLRGFPGTLHRYTVTAEAGRVLGIAVTERKKIDPEVLQKLQPHLRRASEALAHAYGEIRAWLDAPMS